MKVKNVKKKKWENGNKDVEKEKFAEKPVNINIFFKPSLRFPLSSRRLIVNAWGPRWTPKRRQGHTQRDGKSERERERERGRDRERDREIEIER